MNLDPPVNWDHLHVYCACGHALKWCFCTGARNQEDIEFRAILPKGHPDSCPDCQPKPIPPEEFEHYLEVLQAQWEEARQKYERSPGTGEEATP